MATEEEIKIKALTDIDTALSGSMTFDVGKEVALIVKSLKEMS